MALLQSHRKNVLGRQAILLKLGQQMYDKCMVNHVLDANGEKEGKKEGLS
jgi:hypothetical protein